jgi:hypothetical protein
LGPALEIVVPREGQVVGGRAVLLLARSSLPPPAAFGPVFEVSQDGEIFVPLDPEPAPDYGPDSFASALDATLFPSGPLWVRARSGGQTAGPVRLRVNALPQVRCAVEARGREVIVDCSPSADPDGTITAFEFLFGDDEPEHGPAPTARSADPVVSHRYDRPGTFALRVTAYDDLGMWDTWEQLLLVPEGKGEQITLQEDGGCGCAQLLLFTTDTGALRDPRRPTEDGGFERPPLGPDPEFASTNFEVDVGLEPGSEEARCTEGQEVRGSSSVNGVPDPDKHACSAGRPLPDCPPGDNAFCDTRTCRGGTMDGESCEGSVITPGGERPTRRAMLCALAGGDCVGNGDGVCTAYPFAGAARGNDDYRAHSPGDEAFKLVCPTCRAPRWLDAPGFLTREAPFDLRFDADFIAFVRGTAGRQDCQCHFRLTVDWVRDTDPATPGNQPGHRPGGQSGITLIEDAETVRCSGPV